MADGAPMGDGRVRVPLQVHPASHGIASTRLAGKILAHSVLGRKDPLLDLSMARRKPLPYPPEPLRAPLIEAVTSALRGVDAGARPGPLLRALEALGIGFSS